MKIISSLLLLSTLLYFHVSLAQTGPWAKYNGKMKGEALIRDSDGGYLKEVQSIVEGGGDVNWQMEGSGNTPLMAAATAGHLDIVKFLISKGADTGLKDNNGRTALDRAQMAGANDVVKYLKDLQSRRPDTAGSTEAGQTASTIQKKETTGPWAKYNGKMKGEALIRDADGGYLKEVQSIVEGGGDVNWQMEGSGNTPLMAAATAGHLEIVKFLIANGADPQLRDSRGKTAADRAQAAGANDVARFLKSQLSTASADQPAEPPVQEAPPTRPALPVRPARPNQPARPVVPASTVPPGPSKAAPTAWAPFATYKVGDKVKFFAGSWKTGTVKEVGIPGDYSKKIAAPTERKYLISREGAYNWNDWTDWGNVTGMERENYWTGYFIGEWRLGETMAVNTKVEGAQQRDEYTFHAASEALNVLPNGTYQWKTIDKKLITGTWQAAADGAGIVLLKAYQSINWTLRNETNATEENIRGLQSARLTAEGKMSIVAQRRLK